MDPKGEKKTLNHLLITNPEHKLLKSWQIRILLSRSQHIMDELVIVLIVEAEQ